MARKIIPYNKNLKPLARTLRNDSTLGEVLLWNELKNGQLFDFDFHRQKPLLNYIVDLYCYELELVIEIDGIYHSWEEQDVRDVVRESALSAYGLTILRFTESEVRKDMTNVLRAIEKYIFDRHPELFGEP